MILENSFNSIALPGFDGTDYQVWAVKLKAYLDVNDLLGAEEEVYEVPPMTNCPIPTVTLIITRKEKNKENRSLSMAASATVFIRIMTLKTAKEICDFLTLQYEGNDRI